MASRASRRGSFHLPFRSLVVSHVACPRMTISELKEKKIGELAEVARELGAEDCL